MFEEFVTFNFSEGLPTLSVTKNGLTFSKGTVIKMNYPEYAVLLIDKSGKRLAVKACRKEDNNAASFCSAEKKEKNDVLSVRWNSKDLLNTVASMMGWDLKLEAYKIEGQFIEEENAVLFDLNKAAILK